MSHPDRAEGGKKPDPRGRPDARRAQRHRAGWRSRRHCRRAHPRQPTPPASWTSSNGSCISSGQGCKVFPSPMYAYFEHGVSFFPRQCKHGICRQVEIFCRPMFVDWAANPWCNGGKYLLCTGSGHPSTGRSAPIHNEKSAAAQASRRTCSWAIRDAATATTIASSASVAKSVRLADNNYHRIFINAVVAFTFTHKKKARTSLPA